MGIGVSLPWVRDCHNFAATVAVAIGLDVPNVEAETPPAIWLENLKDSN